MISSCVKTVRSVIIGWNEVHLGVTYSLILVLEHLPTDLDSVGQDCLNVVRICISIQYFSQIKPQQQSIHLIKFSLGLTETWKCYWFAGLLLTCFARFDCRSLVDLIGAPDDDELLPASCTPPVPVQFDTLG